MEVAGILATSKVAA